MTIDIYAPTAEDGLSLAELDLYHRITDYRAGLGLPALPLSLGLTTTAGRHVADTRENIWGAGVTLPAWANNLHSWSDAYYATDGSRPEAMWQAPARLGTGYASTGYEIAAAGQEDAAAAFAAWLASPPHRAILDNSGAWAGVSFAAIGIGLSTAPGAGLYGGHVFDIWFGEVADPTGAPPISGSNAGDRVIGTDFADLVSGRDGPDSLSGGAGPDQLGGGANADRLAGGSGGDVLSGGPGADFLLGGLGADLLVGGSARDRLTGNGGNDVVMGGSGRDMLIGGPGADLFRFRTPAEAGAGVGRDVVADFQPGIDHIDLRQIDARPDLPGDQAFAFDPAVAPGTLHYAGGIVSGDLDGDGVADFEIALTGAPALRGGDLLL